ncbi:Cell wall-associated hydrolase, NlpC family [Jatrophihabitans endophyticus]|uniref:Cell wall-associated hydrolase, NlpC family n=1 Tax=Jatrophihabitans endophyticus TaxID=1206085 RepID=A0A1M5IFQ5_9ACTN|nr:NlpC/P60 family protein [Jatrophihabitans endophyticus]SHG27097.1 Cell wall-associated hydrolase, NlpC family [Jatrophihabitans endophyticus]
MTAPADVTSALATITARIQQIETRIASFAPTRTNTVSAANFASTLAATTGTTGTADTATTATTTSSGVTGADVVSTAQKYLGIPYVWGGESTSGMDCSGLVQKTFGDLGIDLPRTAAEQQKEGTAVSSLADAQPGDLVFFGDPAYHVAIYAGNNQIIESPEPGKTVHLTDLHTTPTSIRRIVDAAPVAGTTSGGVGAAQLQAAGVSSSVAAYASQFAAAEQANGLPSGLLAAVAQQESGGNARAVSPAGAQGLMQLMPATAAGMGVDALDPSQAIKAAGRIFGRNLREFGTVPLALAAYNAGAGAVHQYGGIPPYSETQNYVRRITATLAAGG